MSRIVPVSVFAVTILVPLGAIDCWGLETEYTPLPEGAWLAVAATEAYGNCAIPAAGEGVQCWGGLSWDASVDASEIQAAPTTGVWTDLQSGALHWCALDTGGRVDCFGATVDEGFDERWRLYDPPGTYTQLGIGTASNCATRTSGETYCWGGWLDHYGRWAAPADETFTMLAQGEFFGCGLHADGTFTCWGEAPAYPPHLESISAGREHACGLSDQGVVCFGANGHGEVTPPVGASFVEVDAGAAYTCGRTAAGAVTCWGDDAAGLVSSAPATEGHLQVAAGRYQACALEGDGQASCWGDVAADPPRTQFAALTTGARHACGLTDGGIVECWGDNSEGQLTQRGCPDEVAFTAVSAGDYHTCGLCEGGGVVCWGLDAHGQVSGVEPWKFLSVSAGAEHTCGLKSDGIVVCWGRDLEGQTDIGYPWTY